MQLKRAQVASEAAMLIGFMTLVFTLFFFAVGNQVVDTAERQELDLIEDVAEIISTEVDLALLSSAGYERSFSLPSTLRGREYNVTLYNASLLESNSTQVVLNISGGSEYVIDTPKQLGGELCAGSVLLVRTENEVRAGCLS